MNLKFRLGIVSSEAEIDRLPDGYEPLLVAGEPISTSELIEDEVLLAVPAIPLHADGAGDCEMAYSNSGAAQRENPFAVLKQLKS